MWKDGVELQGAFAWSIADKWEFDDFTPRYGVHTVNRTTRERSHKKSSFDLEDFVETKRKSTK